MRRTISVEKVAHLNGRSIPVKEQVYRFILSVELIWGMLHKCLQIPSATPLSCWFHLELNIEKELKKKQYEKSQQEIRSWLLSMHCASSAQEYKEIYNRAVAAVPRRNALHVFVDSYLEKSYFTAQASQQRTTRLKLCIRY